MPDPAIPAAPTSALEAMDLALAGNEAPDAALPAPDAPDPQPGDALPPPDSAPKTPEGDGATDPDDNAPPTPPDKPDDKKTEVPVDPAKDDPAVEVPGKDGGGPTKKPSDEFGELPKDAKEETRERFNVMKEKYDGLHKELGEARAAETRWVETVKSTGATPQQFGETLGYLRDVNEGTPESLGRAYEKIIEEAGALAKLLGKPLPGVYDPLDAHPDLKAKVEDEDNPLPRDVALELAATRAAGTLSQARERMQASVADEETVANEQLELVKQFGAQMKSTDPDYDRKQEALRPIINSVIGRLPPSQWLGAIREEYAAVKLPPVAAAVPDIPATLRPTGSPGAGSVKEPGNPLEAMNQAMGW